MAQLSADGASLIYGTYLGGSGLEAAEGVALRSSGAAVVVGRTSSTDFPTTPGVLQPSGAATSQDGFVTRLNAAGSALEYSTFLSGSGGSACRGIAVGNEAALFVNVEVEV